MRVLLVATVQSHICQFHRPLVAMLHEHGCEVHAAARNNLAEKNGLKLDFVEQVFDVPFQRSPFSLKNITAYRQLKRIIDQGHYDVIHCNTPVGGVLGRLAAREMRKKGTRVFYTAHGFHFYKGAPKSNWLIWYPIERYMSQYCDKLITISNEDDQLARSHFPCQVEHIHGVGVDPMRYRPLSEEEWPIRRQEEKLTENEYVILCVGELNQNKNQDKLISAAAKLKEEIPNLKVLLAGNGPREAAYRRQIEDLGVYKQVKLLGYRTDLEKLTPIVDLVVSCSRREGLGLNIIEGMLCRKPVVAAHNRGHDELIEDGVNGFLVGSDDIDAYIKKIDELYQNPTLAMSMGTKGYEKAQSYTYKSVTNELKDIYEL